MADYLTIDQILAAKDIVEEDFDVPEWGGRVRIKSLSVEEATAVTRASRKPDQQGQMVVNMDRAIFETVIRGVISPKIDAAHFDAFKKKSSSAMLHISNRIQEISNLSISNEELRKNSRVILS